ncbi:MAG TPA: hypothetical protein VMW52_05590 [Phycisphaerae bacterium]|nr:hypothetical protein [Phycisphaerae bacterium]
MLTSAWYSTDVSIENRPTKNRQSVIPEGVGRLVIRLAHSLMTDAKAQVIELERLYRLPDRREERTTS